jgi:cytochrome c-type biogenesis protein CcmH
MTLWFVMALMTAAALFAVLWPLAWSTDAQSGSDLAVYRDQLDEIERDRASGLIGEMEAQAARVEISRRLLAAADTAKPATPSPGGSSLLNRRVAAVTAIVFLPIVGSALYLALGSPQLPGSPLQARLSAADQSHSIANLISKVEAHLEQNPDDARGYEVLAPVYLRLGRFSDAVNARRKLLALNGDNAERQSDLGEALTAAAEGVVTNEAKAAFEHATQLDPADPKAKFFIGLAAEQHGDRAEAAAIWRDMVEKAPADAAWLPMVHEALARVNGAPSGGERRGPSADDVAAASSMNEKDRGAMIRAMVTRLADRLKQNGSDVEGWQQLLRAYVVLGDRGEAKKAATDAKRALENDPEKLRRIESVIKALGLDG